MVKSNVLLLLTVFQLSLSAKLNVPRVLLPFSNEGTSFLLQADQGCFTWKSTRPEVVKVTPLNPTDSGCSSAASVSSNSKSWIKSQAVIMAEDGSGLILRCDVIVDVIKSLQIVTKTHELFLEEAPEEYWVRAYDEEGNEFSTLENIIFKWNIDNTVKTNSAHNIRFINFRDSPYAIEESLRDIEARGEQGWKVLLEGIKTGFSRVSVRLSSSSYSTVPQAEVVVMVVANLFVVPHSAFIMIGAEVEYHAEQMKNNKIYKISLPSPQYYLQVADLQLASLETPNLVSGLQLGSTEVLLRDKNVGPDESIKTPSASLHIVTPSYITITILPHKNWNVIVGNEYDLVFEIFDQDNNKMLASNNLVMEVEIPAEYFRVDYSTTNGTFQHGVPLKPGTADVKATLLGVKIKGKLHRMEQPISAMAQMEIYDRIVLVPQLSVFPWDPISRHHYTVKYSILGSDSASPFTWSSSNTSVATVTQNGVGKTNTLVGETVIQAAMNRASHNKGEATVIMVPAIGLAVVRDVVEVEAGKQLQVPISFHGRHNGATVYFTECTHLPFEVKFSAQNILALEPEKANTLVPEKACTVAELSGAKPGFSKIKVSYTYPSADGVVSLSDEAQLAVFKPLTPIQPSSGETLLALKSSLQLVWTGGPQPWIEKPDSHFHTLSVEDKTVIDTVTSTAKHHGTFVYEVKCLKLGSTTVTLTVGNRPSASLPKPVKASSSVTVFCGEPDKLELQARIPQPVDTSIPCPSTARTGRVAAQCYEDLEIIVNVEDDAGRRFDNISTLEIGWSLTDSNLGSLERETQVHSPPTDLGYRSIGKAYNTLKTKGASGFVDVSAKLKQTWLFGSIHDDLQLNLVEDAEVSPNSKNIFNHPDNAESVNVLYGSGYFDITSSSASVAESRYFALNQTIRVSPLDDGETILTVKDLCLRSRKSAQARISVSGVHKVELIVTDKLQKGRSDEARVRLLDRSGHPIPPSAMKFVTLTPKPASTIVRFTPKEDGTFSVKGIELGETTAIATVVFGTRQVSSQPSQIQVFPPLELDPRNLTLIIGAKFQVLSFGGPQPDSSVEFVLKNTKIAQSNNVGLVEALVLGSTELIGRAVGIDKITGKQKIYSEDRIPVHVVKFDGLRIHTPILRMRTGTEMPITAMGTDEHQNCFSFGSAQPEVHLSWTLDPPNAEIGRLENVFYRSGVSGRSGGDLGAMRFRAVKPGRVTIRLEGKITHKLEGNQFQFDKDQTFKDQVEIVIFDDLRLHSPPVDKNSLLMTTNSAYQLRANREGGIYEVIHSTSSLVTVSKSGLVKSGRQTGSCVVFLQVKEDFGIVQHLSLVVDVKPISYMMINAIEAFHPDGEVMVLPKGVEIPLQVSFHDNTGQAFEVTDQTPLFRPSRFDTVALREANDTHEIELLREQFTVLRAYTQTLQDFIVFNVRQSISPDMSQLAVGDVIDFDSQLGSEGRWSSDPPGMLAIDGATGVATLLRSGVARVTHEGMQKTTIDLDIKPAVKLSIVETPLLTTDPADPQAVIVKIHSAEGPSTNVQGRPQQYIFSCQAKATQFTLEAFFDVKPGFSNNAYACVFHPKTAVLSQSKTALMAGEIELIVQPAPGHPHLQGDRQTIPFLPQFRLVTKEIQLSNGDPYADVAVQGLVSVLDNVKVDVSDSKYLETGRPYYKDGSTRATPVYLKQAYWSEPVHDLHLTLTSATTKQRVNVPIKVSFSADQCSRSELGWGSLVFFALTHYQSLLFIVAACTICVFLTKLIIQNAKPKPSKPASNNGYPAPLPTTPRQSPLTNAENKPYLWTVDNSPVYGSPTLNRRSPRSMTQYSYSDQ